MIMDNTIILSEDKKYQYMYGMAWDDTKPCVCFVGLNPRVNQTGTLQKMIGFAKDGGYGGMYLVHLFAYRSDNYHIISSGVLKPIGSLTDLYIKLATSVSDKVICCWGPDGERYNRGSEVIMMLTNAYYYQRAANGEPKGLNQIKLTSPLKPIEHLYESV